MFNMVRITHDAKNDIYNVSGFFGSNFRNRLIRKIGIQKIDALFIKYGLVGFSFYGFFLPEVLYVMENIMISSSSYGVNVSTIRTFVKEMNKLMDDEKQSHLDTSVIPKLMHYKILEDQEKAFIKYDLNKNKLHYRGLLFDMGTGTGKTFTGLGIAESAHADIIITIVPNNSVDNVWIKGITEEIYKEPQEYYLVKDRTGYNGEKFIISNFESLQYIKDIVPELQNKKVSLIVDECHNFLDIKATRTKELLYLITYLNPEDLILLSGTTLKSGIQELAVIIRMLDTRFHGAIERRFFGLYRNPGNVFKETLKMRYGDFSVKVTKENVGPKPIVRNITVSLDNGTKYTLPVIAQDLKDYFERRIKELEDDIGLYTELYTRLYQKAKEIQLRNGVKIDIFNEYERNVIAVVTAYKKGKLRFIGATIVDTNMFEKKYIITVLEGEEKRLFREAKTVYKYPSLKVQGEALANVIGKARMECHADMAKVINYQDILESTPKKTLIFSTYIDVCEAALKTVYKQGYKPLGVYGDFVKDLTKTVNRFTDDPDINPLVATYKSLGESVPVVAANIVIILDTPFRMYIYEQAIARVWRRGQDMQTYVYIPLLNTGDIPNINSRNIDIIAFFKTEVEKITGFASDISVLGESDVDLSLEEFKEIKPPMHTVAFSLESLIKNW